MKKVFSYYRVSSRNQEQTGVSLEVQQEANQKYASQHDLIIEKEYREVQSAAKSGRKHFNLMLKELKQSHDIRGIVFHDVDRSSRSLGDWARIQDLVDQGYEIHFSREGTFMGDRSSRLMGDIKAVVAQDFIRNLSQETKKGMYKRLEDGYCVVGHFTVGYISQVGSGGVKVVDPLQAPLVKEAFELYATEGYSLKELADVMYQKGLRSTRGNKIDGKKIDRILKNKFYIGLMEVKDKIFQGRHEPIISPKLFDKVQEILKRRYMPRPRVHNYKFQNLLHCVDCGNRLRTTKAKKHYHYYYCRNKKCSMKAVREEIAEKEIISQLKKIKFTKLQVKLMLNACQNMKHSLQLTLEERNQATQLRIDSIKSRLSKLLDMKLDIDFPVEVFEEKKKQLLIELRQAESELNETKEGKEEKITKLEQLANLLRNPVRTYKLASYENKRRFINSIMKDIRIKDNYLEFEWRDPFNKLVKMKNKSFSKKLTKSDILEEVF